MLARPFTGVRIGRELPRVSGNPQALVLAVSSMANMAYEASLATQKQAISVFMHARESEYYLGTYHLSPGKNEFRVISEQVVGADSISEACLTENLAIDTGDWVLTGDALQSVLEKGLTTGAGDRFWISRLPLLLCGLAELMKNPRHADIERVAQANYVKEVLDYPKS